MRTNNAFGWPDRFDAILMKRLATVQKAALAIAAGFSGASILWWAIPGVHGIASDDVMSMYVTISTLGCLVALWPRERSQVRTPRFKQLLGAGVGVLALLEMLERGFRGAEWPWLRSVDRLFLPPGEMTAKAGCAFLLLASLIVLLDVNRGWLSWIVDTVGCLSMLISVDLFTARIFAATGWFPAGGASTPGVFSVLVIALLTFVAVGRRAEYGRFAIYLQTGYGGRLVRRLTPVLLTLPIVRELVRALAFRAGILGGHSSAAALVSLGAMLGLLLLVLVARHIWRMEQEIRDLSLRDELTGLYNLRGFNLLGEQSLRLAHRLHAPFSVLFIDVDNLKRINDTLGHAAGSELLIETAELLKTNFRETDVIARVGGDEFAVAGHFSSTAMEECTHRLGEHAAAMQVGGNESLSLGLSVGHVTNSATDYETLQELVEKADALMYDQKRRKKLQLC